MHPCFFLSDIAMSLKSQIESYAGAYDQGSLTPMIKRSISKVIAIAPKQMLLPSVTLMGGIGSGASIAEKKVISVGNNAREVTEAESYRFMDAGSIYHILTARDQIYWLSGDMIYSHPDDADVEVLDYSHVAESDDHVGCLPLQLTEAVVLDCAIQILQSRISSAPFVPFTLYIKSEESLRAFSSYGYGGLYCELYGGISNIVSLVYPRAVGSLIIEWDNLADITDRWTSDVQYMVDRAKTELDDINYAIIYELGEGLTPDGNEDLEKGSMHLQHLNARISGYVQQVDVLLKKILTSADIEKTNKVQMFSKTVEDSRNTLSKFAQELQLFVSHGQLVIAEHKEESERIQLAMAMIKTLQDRYLMVFAPFEAVPPGRGQ
jgi:hypothetical protein